MLRDGYPARVCDRMATALRLQRAVYLTCAATMPHASRRTEVTSPSIPASALRRPCGHGRVAAPGARSAGGAALWPAGAASCGVRMPLRGDAWRRGSPRVYRWPCERPGGLSRAPARTALWRGFAVVRFAAARRGPLDLRTRRVANPQGHQRFMDCSCAATVVHETPLLCVTRTAGRAAS